MILSARRLEVRAEKQTIVRDVSLDVLPGEVLGIIGPNGAGKSTLLRALAGLLRPASGAVLADDTPLGSLTFRERASRLAFVAQDTGTPADITALDLVLMGRYARRRRLARLGDEDAAIAREALARVGMAELAERVVPTLSGGERQLIQIARALAQRAGILLLDEPTSALDVHHQMRVFSILRRAAAQDSAVAVVLHDLDDAARYCDRIAVVHDGVLAAVGAPAEVLTPELLADVYRIDARVHLGEGGFPHVFPLSFHEADASIARTPIP